MDRTVSRTLPRRLIRLTIVVIAGLALTGCSKLSGMFGSESSSGKVSQTMSESSKAVNAAAADVAESLGLASAAGGAAPVEKPKAAQPAASKAAAPKAGRPRARSNSPALAALPTGPTASFQPNREPVVVASSEADNVIETATSAATSPVVLDPHYPVYSKDDYDVLPARLITTREGGPVFRGIRPEMNTMELIISRQGRVEQVRLLTPARRMTDMLLLSGAKTWKFTPALKEGQPVRYRTMFSWESTP